MIIPRPLDSRAGLVAGARGEVVGDFFEGGGRAFHRKIQNSPKWRSSSLWLQFACVTQRLKPRRIPAVLKRLQRARTTGQRGHSLLQWLRHTDGQYVYFCLKPKSLQRPLLRTDRPQVCPWFRLAQMRHSANMPADPQGSPQPERTLGQIQKLTPSVPASSCGVCRIHSKHCHARITGIDADAGVERLQCLDVSET